MRDESSISAPISGIENSEIKKKLLETELYSFDHTIQLANKHERIYQTLAGNTVVNDEGEFSVLQVISHNTPSPPTLTPSHPTPSTCIQDTLSSRARLAFRPSARASKGILHTTHQRTELALTTAPTTVIYNPSSFATTAIELVTKPTLVQIGDLETLIMTNVSRVTSATELVVCTIPLLARALGLCSR